MAGPVRILLVEDEEHIQEVIRMNLELEGYSVVVNGSGKQALQTFRQGRFDLILLDVMLPEIDGFSVCQTIRLENDRVPIMLLTAKGSQQDKVQGLKYGADDYLTKPFNLEELLLRVSNLLKRSGLQAGNAKEMTSFSFANNQINFSTYEIQGQKGEVKTLSSKEIRLLKLLIERDGEVVSRDEILEKVWGYDVYPSTRTIDNYILAFRKYFEADSKNPQFFHSVRGVGYKFTSNI